MSTVVAAVYGSPTQSYEDLIGAASIVKARMRRELGVVDVDDTVDEDQTKYVFEVDKQKAALNGVSTDEIARTIGLALGSQAAGAAQIPYERTPVKNRALVSPRRAIEHDRPGADLRQRHRRESGSLVGSRRLANHHRGQDHLSPPTPACSVRAGRDGGPAAGGNHPGPHGRPSPGRPAEFRRYAGAAPSFESADDVSQRRRHPVGGARTALPSRWWDEGEMYITIHLFRDLAFAMLTALIAIYIILMNQTGSYRLPLTIMRAIPLMVIGVMPGFWLLNQIGQHSIGGFRNPVFFSGPAFIGMIALAGIVTRNSIIIVDFIQLGLLRGLSLEEAILNSVSVRLRPILLTSGAAVLGAIPITLDTVFGGMAWSLIFGLIVSTLFSLFVIPVTYNIVYAKKPDHGLPEQHS